MLIIAGDPCQWTYFEEFEKRKLCDPKWDLALTGNRVNSFFLKN
jgi:hypothetical protein